MNGFTLDTNAVNKADSVSNHITTSGYYEGTFKRVSDQIGREGGHGVKFEFESVDGLTTEFTLWVESKTGEKTFSRDILNAGMACLKLRQVLAQQGTVREWDSVAKSFIEKQGIIYPDFCGKKIGIIIQKQEYIKNDGSIGFQINLKHFINAETKQTGGEVLRSVPAEKFDKLVTRYEDIKIEKPKQTPPTQTANVVPVHCEAEVGEPIPF